jgi:hypothetical protein
MVFSPDADGPLAAVQEKGPENVRALVFVACKESRAVLNPTKVRDPEKWAPVFGKDHAQRKGRDPEKWAPVFGKDHAQTKR